MKFKIIIYIIFIFILLSNCNTHQKKIKSEILIDNILKGNYNIHDAEIFIKDASSEDYLRDPDLYYLSSLVYFQLNDTKSMDSILNAWNNHHDYRYFYSKSSYYFKINKLDSSLKYIQIAINMEKNDHALYNLRGAIYYNLENNNSNFEIAKTSIYRAIEIMPISLYYYNLSKLFYKYENFDSTIHYMNIAIAKDSLNFDYIKERGAIFYKARIYDAALNDFKKCYGNDPNDVENIYNLAISYMRNNDFENGCKYMKEVNAKGGIYNSRDYEIDCIKVGW